MEETMKKIAVFIVVALAFSCGFVAAQEAGMKPVTVGQPMPDFTLPAFQDGTVTLSALKGKNVMIIFPRGYAAENAWCTICNYKYAELIELEKTQQFRKKYNVEVLIVLPYGPDVAKAWVDVLPDQMNKVKERKYPADPAKLDEKGKQAMERYRQLFPLDLNVKKGEVPTPFPILIDADRKLSKGLGLFMTEWGGSKADQNIPSVYIVDAKGTLVFKYLGQNTVDRPGYDYLFRVLEVVNGME
jgi:peroxiredoxin